MIAQKCQKFALDFNKAKDTVYSDIKSVVNEFSFYTPVNLKKNYRFVCCNWEWCRRYNDSN